jgi:universal stress protein A
MAGAYPAPSRPETAKNARQFAIVAERIIRPKGNLLLMEAFTLAAPIPTALHLKKILVPMDFSAPSQRALDFAVRLAKQFRSAVTLLHVVEKTAVGSGFADIPSKLDFSDEQFSMAEKNLRTLSASLRPAGSPTVDTAIRTGLPAHEIVEAAKEFDADLIVIATHGYTGWKHFCIGSTAERVVCTAPCPVFVVREKEHDLG